MELGGAHRDVQSNDTQSQWDREIVSGYGTGILMQVITARRKAF